MMMTKEARILGAALGGILLTAGAAAADDQARMSEDVVEDEQQELDRQAQLDPQIYGQYEGGFDEATTEDDWFFDYYELRGDVTAEGEAWDDPALYEDDLWEIEEG
jgi:hypothetical protein